MPVSVVVITRNDNFGGNMFELGTACLQTMSKTFDEIILIDFGSQEPLYPVFNERITEKKGNIRVIHVPKAWVVAHVGDDTTMADVLGRNIGIRRATHDIIASSNIDIIPGPLHCFDFNQFDANVFYTSNKYMIDFLMIRSWREQGISWENIQSMLIETKDNYYRQPDWIGDPWSKISGCGDFQIAHRDIWFHPEVRGFEETLIYKEHTDTNVQKKVIENAHHEVRPAHFFHVFHQSHTNIRGTVRANDLHASVWNFGKTTNPETWGFSQENFEENRI